MTTSGLNLHGVAYACLLSLIGFIDARAGDATIIKGLKEKGVTIAETKGGLSIAD